MQTGSDADMKLPRRFGLPRAPEYLPLGPRYTSQGKMMAFIHWVAV